MQQFNVCSHRVSFVEVIEAKRRLTDNTIRDAVKMWCGPATRQAVVDKYGEIGDWDVSHVTNMSGLFWKQKDFNENISRWDTSNVTTMTLLCTARLKEPPHLINQWRGGTLPMSLI